MRTRLLWVVALAAVTFASCSSGDDDTASPATNDETTAPTAAETTTSTAPPYAGYESEVYAAPEHWLCRPDLASDLCREGLDTTVVQADGSTEVVNHEVVDDPGIDCFYVYPTVNMGDEGNASIEGDPTTLEVSTTRTQAGPFSSLCRVFAPRYRQVTLASFGTEGVGEIAYGDVIDAFKYYMANDNGGRGVVLMGHSQGSGHLNRLIQEEIDADDTLRARLVSALLLGSGVAVAEGEDVGGDFANVPACRAPDQVGCVVTYASFRKTSPPPADSFFGRPRGGDGTVLCTNPAALAGGAAVLDPWFSSGSPAFAEGADAPEITTPFIVLPGLVSGECVQKGGFSYFEITVNGDPADPRVDKIGGDLTPVWGLHAIDVNLALGNLLDLVQTQSAAWLDAR